MQQLMYLFERPRITDDEPLEPNSIYDGRTSNKRKKSAAETRERTRRDIPSAPLLLSEDEFGPQSDSSFSSSQLSSRIKPRKQPGRKRGTFDTCRRCGEKGHRFGSKCPMLNETWADILNGSKRQKTRASLRENGMTYILVFCTPLFKLGE